MLLKCFSISILGVNVCRVVVVISFDPLDLNDTHLFQFSYICHSHRYCSCKPSVQNFNSGGNIAQRRNTISVPAPSFFGLIIWVIDHPINKRLLVTRVRKNAMAASNCASCHCYCSSSGSTMIALLIPIQFTTFALLWQTTFPVHAATDRRTLWKYHAFVPCYRLMLISLLLTRYGQNEVIDFDGFPTCPRIWPEILSPRQYS